MLRQLSDQETAGPLFQPQGLREADGAVWVLDGGNQRLVRVRGGPVVSVGRRGTGPGEYQDPRALFVDGDGGLVVWDRLLTRMTRLPPGGEGTPRTELLEVRLPGLMLDHALPLGGGYAGIFNRSVDALNQPPEGQEPAAVLGALRLDELRVDTFAAFPTSGPVVVRSTTPDGARSMAVFSPPFDAPPYADATPACGGFAAASVGGRGFRIAVLDGERGVVDEWRRDEPPPLVAADEVERYFGQFSDETHRHDDLRRLIRVPERHAAVQRLRLTSAGQLWVRITPPRPAAEPVRWLVRVPVRPAAAGPTAWRSFQVELPAAFSVQEARADTVWGFTRTELDEPRVEVRLLERPLPSGCQAQ